MTFEFLGSLSSRHLAALIPLSKYTRLRNINNGLCLLLIVFYSFSVSEDTLSNNNEMEDKKKLGSSENCRNVEGGVEERLMENFLYIS